MASSDERREVAARLRSAAKTDSGSPDYLWNRLEIAVNGWRFGDVIDDSYVFYNSVLSRLADLIDPTCKILDAHWDDGQRTWGCICSSCDAHLEHKKSEYLRYCPECGMRNVNAN